MINNTASLDLMEFVETQILPRYAEFDKAHNLSHVNNASGNKMMFLTPHYPMNGNVLRFGVSWNFYN